MLAVLLQATELSGSLTAGPEQVATNPSMGSDWPPGSGQSVRCSRGSAGNTEACRGVWRKMEGGGGGVEGVSKPPMQSGDGAVLVAVRPDVMF